MRSAPAVAAAFIGYVRRFVSPVLVGFAVLFSSGCAILELEKTNRGGYLDYAVDQHWMKADSKSMRALRAFAIQVSLARLASVSAKNESDRQLLAIRIGALTKRFLPIYSCAFDKNPLGVAGAESDPCFYYDSAMVDYSGALFDLAMVALPIDDARKLVTSLTGSVTGNPINILELLDSLLSIAREGIKVGRVVGGLYRDTVELEVQLWLGTPDVDNRPPPYRVTDADVAALREIYAVRNDNMPAWIAEMAALRSRGLEPVPQAKFFGELAGLLNYLCDLITRDPTANSPSTCKAGLPKTLPSPPPVIGSLGATRVGGPIAIFQPGTGGGFVGSGGGPGPSRGSSTAGTQVGSNIGRTGQPEPGYDRIIVGYDPAVFKTEYVRNVLSKLCVRATERAVTPRMNALIRVYQLNAYGGEIQQGRRTVDEVVTGKLTPAEMTLLTGISGSCPDDRANFYEWRDRRFSQGINSQSVINLVNGKLEDPQRLPTTASVQAVRDKILSLRSSLAGSLTLKDDVIANQFTPDLVSALRN